MASNNDKNSRRDGRPRHFAMNALARAVRSTLRKVPDKAHRQMKFEALEPRVLLSADPFTAALAGGLPQDWSHQAESLVLSPGALADLTGAQEALISRNGLADGVDLASDEALVLGRTFQELADGSAALGSSWIVEPDGESIQRQVVFVDSRVEGFQDLIDAILPEPEKDGPTPVIDVFVLTSERDGIEQITEYLAEHEGIAALHILSHGASGSLQLGSGTVDAEVLQEQSAQLNLWGQSFVQGADILLYGCNVGGGQAGLKLVQDLSALTGADVAASSDLTGNAQLGGDWDLELSVGEVDVATLAESFELAAFSGVLDGEIVITKNTGIFSNTSTFVIGTTLDLSSVSKELRWTISSSGIKVVGDSGDVLEVQGALVLKAGTGANHLIFERGAKFGTEETPGEIRGKAFTTLSFTPNLDDPDEFYTPNRVSAPLDIDLNSSGVIHFGDVWFRVFGVDTVIGGKGDDMIIGFDNNSSYLTGGRGDDTLAGGDIGFDVLRGGVGNDTLVGNFGEDGLYGGDGNDTIYGDKDSPLATGNGDDDTMAGSKGDDTYVFFDNWGNDSVDELADEGHDRLDLSRVTAPLTVNVGNANPFVSIIDWDAPSENSVQAGSVERVDLGTGANRIVVAPDFESNFSGTLTISNRLSSEATPLGDDVSIVYYHARASLDLSSVADSVEVTVSAYNDQGNPNGNKVTVKFASGAKLVVFNVADITTTSGDDRVVVEDGAPLVGTLDLGAGDDEITIEGQSPVITALIVGGDAPGADDPDGEDRDLIRFDADVELLNGLAVGDSVPGDLPGDAYAVRFSLNESDAAIRTSGFEALASDAVRRSSSGSGGAPTVSPSESELFDALVAKANNNETLTEAEIVAAVRDLLKTYVAGEDYRIADGSAADEAWADTIEIYADSQPGEPAGYYAGAPGGTLLLLPTPATVAEDLRKGFFRLSLLHEVGHMIKSRGASDPNASFPQIEAIIASIDFGEVSEETLVFQREEVRADLKGIYFQWKLNGYLPPQTLLDSFTPTLRPDDQPGETQHPSVEIRAAALAEYISLLTPDATASSYGGALFGDDAANEIIGSSTSDFLSGGGGDDQLIAGSGSDVLAGDDGDDELTGGSGADRYVFENGWGHDEIRTVGLEKANDTLDFSAVTGSLRYILYGGDLFVGNNNASPLPGFDFTAREFISADNSVHVRKGSFLGENELGEALGSTAIGTIRISGAQTHEFVFGNDWNATVIDVPDGTSPVLILDFRRVYEELRFEFRADGSLVVTALGGIIDQARDYIPNAGRSITITNVGPNTTIWSGSNSNIYRVQEGVDFQGELKLVGGEQKRRFPFTESHYPTVPLDTVEHTIDLGQSVGTQLSELGALVGDLANKNGAAFGSDLKSLLGARINFVDLLLGTSNNLLGTGELIRGIENVTRLNGATIENVMLGPFSVNVVQGDLGANEFTVKQGAFGAHVLSGLTGPDTYNFGNFWGFGFVAELPNIEIGEDGIPLPTLTDTLNFSGVVGQDLEVDVYSSSADFTDEFSAILGELGIDTSWLSGISLDSNFVVVTAFIEGKPTPNLVMATDIESIVGPTLGTLTVRLHGDASLRGTVAPGGKGDVVLDYSDFDGPVETRLETLNIPIADFSVTNLAFDLLLDVIGLENPFPESTTGSATGINGANLAGFTTLFDFFGSLAKGEQISLLDDFAVSTVTKVVGSAYADTHMLSSVAKEYEIGAGDSIVAPTEFLPSNVRDLVPEAFAPDIHTIGQTTLRFDFNGAGDEGLDLSRSGVELDLSKSTGNLKFVVTEKESGETWDFVSDVLSPGDVLEPEDDEPFSYRIYSGKGNDKFWGSTRVDTFIFEDEWGTDVVDLTSGSTKDVTDVLDFTAVSGVVGAWDGDDLVFRKDGNSVTVKGAKGAPGKVEWRGISGPIQATPNETGEPLLAAQPSALDPLTLDDIEALLAEAIRAFDGRLLTLPGVTSVQITLSAVTSTGSDGSPVTRLVTDAGLTLIDSSSLTFAIDNLPGTALSTRDATGQITIDTTAADHGWYVGAAAPDGESGVDLLSVLTHELALIMGLDPSLAVMASVIDAGGRTEVPADLGLQEETTDLDLTTLAVSALPAGAISVEDDLSSVLDEAIARWALQQFTVAGEVWADPTAVLNGVVISVADLDGDEVARTREDGSIVLDYTAAGHGWYTGIAEPLPGETGIDLLTTLMHELGHKLGVTHDAAAGTLMSNDLTPGERRDVPGGVIALLELDPAGQTALAQGLGAFSAWAAGLGARLDGLLDDTSIPFTDASVRSLLGLDDTSAEALVLAATAGLRDAVVAALGTDPTAAGILAIDGTAAGNYAFTITKAPNSDPNSFIVTIDLLPDSTPVAGFDLEDLTVGGAAGFQVKSDLNLTATTHLTLKVEFGLNRSGEFYIAAPNLLADLEVTSGSEGFTASISFGPLGLSIVDGRIEVDVATRIGAEGLVDMGSVDPAQIDPLSSGRYGIDLPLQLRGGINGVETDEVGIRASGILPLAPTDFVSFLKGIDVQFENFNQLFEFHGFSLNDLLDALSGALDALIRTDGLLYQKIPGIEQSMADLLGDQLFGQGADFLEDLKATIDLAREGDLGTAETLLNIELNKIFGAGSNPISIIYQDSVLILQFSLEKALASFERVFKVDLQSFATELGLGDYVGAIESVLSIESSDVKLAADIFAGFDLGVGLDLRSVFEPTRVVSSDSRLFARLDAGTAAPADIRVNLDLSALNLPKVVFGIDDGTVDLRLLLEFGLPQIAEGFYAAADVPAAEVRISGGGDIDLPLVLGSQPVGGTAEDLNGDGFGDNVLHIGASFAGSAFEFEVASPYMDQLFDLAAWLNNPENIVNGLNQIFDVFEAKVGDQISGLDLPFIGGALDEASGFVSDIRGPVIGAIQAAIAADPDATTIELVRDALQDALQDLLKDDSPIAVALAGDSVEFNFVISDTILSRPIAIDLGLDELITFNDDAKVQIQAGYTFAFGFGFSVADGFYLATDGAAEGGEEFLINLAATIDGLEFTGALPLLAVTVRDLTGTEEDDDDQASGILGAFSIDLQDFDNDGKLTLGETATIAAEFTAEANVDLELEVRIPNPEEADPEASPLFPTIWTNLRYDQLLAQIGTSGSSGPQTPDVFFEDVRLDLGEFISGFVEPIVSDVADVLSPLTDPLPGLDISFRDLLKEDIQLLVDLGLNETNLLGIASAVLGQTKYDEAIKGLNALDEVIALVEAVTAFTESNPGDLIIEFGDFQISGGAATASGDNPDPVDPSKIGEGTTSTGSQEADNVVSRFGSTEGSFQFPLLTQPSRLLDLLLGKTTDLFTYDMPALKIEDLRYVRSIPIFPGLNARFGGEIDAYTDFKFVFDTTGFEKWKAQGFAPEDALLLLDGIYIDDNGIENTAGDAPEVMVSASIIAGASLGIGGLAEAGVDGDITFKMAFDLNDTPDLLGQYDGRIYGDELAARLQQGVECVFDISGKLSFGLSAFLWVGADLGILGKVTVFEARERFAGATIFDFVHECPDPVETELGTVENGLLTLDIGAGDSDTFIVSRELLTDAEGNSVDKIVLRSGSAIDVFDPSQVTKIKAVGTSGNDRIIIGPNIEADIDIEGGLGNDVIEVRSGGYIAGGAPLIKVRGGDGEDEIVIDDDAVGRVDVDGGRDNDRIMVGSVGGYEVLIRGGLGDDTIIGSEVADLIYGDGGRDVIYGFGGNDEIYGGDFDGIAPTPENGEPFTDDLLLGGEGDDVIHGGTGNDRLSGDEGNDELYGDDGDDSLTGGLDIDELYGGRDSDTIVWRYGDGEDTVWDGGVGASSSSSSDLDSVQLSGTELDEDGNSVPRDDTVLLGRTGAQDVGVHWSRTGVAGSLNTFDLQQFEQIVVNVGDGGDAVTVNDLDGTTVRSLSVDFGVQESISTTEATTQNEEGEPETATFEVRNVALDAGADTLNLFGSLDDDIYTLRSTGTPGDPDGPSTTGVLIEQAKTSAAAANRKILDISILSPNGATDFLNIDTGDGDDTVDASAIFRNDFKVLGITTGDDQDIVVGSPFVDDIDTGRGNDRVTGGAGVDLFTDIEGDDKLIEARDVNFTLSDAVLAVMPLGPGVNADGSVNAVRSERLAEEEIEALNGIFEEVYLTGYNASEGNDGVGSINIFNVSEFTGDAFLNGGAASDIYNIQLSGGAAAAFISFIDIIDDGGPENAGIDVLNLEGTNEADTFRFDTDIVERISGGSEAGFSRETNFSTDVQVRTKGELLPGQSVQAVNYLTTEDMVVHGRGGNDLFIVDDSSTELFVYGDSGDDNFFIGSVTALAEIDNPNGEGKIQVVDRTAPNGGVTNGVSFPASFYGGKGNDYFEVNHNIAEISLYGQDGDDIFFLKALLTTEPVDSDNDGVPDDEYTPQEDINVVSAPGESDTLAYVKNAPVNIFGGEGFDTLVIVGTVIDDTFVIFTEWDDDLGREVQRIFGAGLIVPTIDSIERVQLITGAGDDTVYLYGTLDDQEILINTGTGNDIVQIGGDELTFEVTIPESKYTRIERIPQPDLVTQKSVVIPSLTWYTWQYEKLFGFFGPSWIPKLVRNFVPEREVTRTVITPQAPLELPTVVTVPEFTLQITVPETRDLEKINGPVFIDGVLADGGDDSIVIDNRYGDVALPGTLQKSVVEAVEINTGEGEEALAKSRLSGALPGGVDVGVVYGSVVSYLEDQHRVRQPGLVDAMLGNPSGTTAVELRPGQRIQAFESGDVLGALLGYLPGTSGTYADVDGEAATPELVSFNLSELSASGGNGFLPDDVFFTEYDGLGTVEVELLYDLNGNLIGANVFAEDGLSLTIANSFVRSSVLDPENTRVYDALSGFGLGIGVFYENFTLVDLQLSNGDDVLTLEDTTATAVTNIFGGGGHDRIEVNNTSGTLNLFGDVAGSDTAGLGIPSNVAGGYAEDYRDADNAAAIGSLLGLGAPFDPASIPHIKALAAAMNGRFDLGIKVDKIENVINLDTNNYAAQIWELLKSELNVLQGDSSDYREFLGGEGAYATFATDLGAFAGLAAGTAFDPENRGHLAALAERVNGKSYRLTVEIGLAGSINSLTRDLNVFSSFVSQLLGPDGLDIFGDGSEVTDYRSPQALVAMGEAFELGEDFDLNNRAHLQYLASLVNDEKFQTTVQIDVNGDVQQLTSALDTLEKFVWQTLKTDLTYSGGAPYNPLEDNGLPLKYRDQLVALGAILGVGTFDPSDVSDVKRLAERLNADFNDLGIDVAAIALEPNLDLDGYRLEIWTLITEAGLVEVPSGNDVFNIQRTGAEVTIHGQAGNDTVNLNNATLGSWLTAMGQGGDDDFNVDEIKSLTSLRDRDDGRGEIRDSVDFDGGDGSDDYYIDLTGERDLRINVLDTGTDGEDDLTIDGTELADTFLLRRVAEVPNYAADEPAFVALVQGALDEILANSPTRPDSYERINYDANINGFLTVNGLIGDDYFASDDNAARTVLDGGDDNDTFQVGQIYRTARVEDAVDPADSFATVETTRGFLSRGVSYETTIIGGEHEDRVSVYSNQAELTLQGNGGNDAFEVRAFELADGSGYSTDSGTAIETGDGDDTVQYNVNAPVSIDGGDGFDSIVVLGTESPDSFVITDIGVFGAGLTVYYDNAESVQIDGLEGDDTFFILSTAENVLTTVIGGLGSDIFNVAGDITNEITSAGWTGDAEQGHTLTGIRGPLVIEGHYLEGANRSLAKPVVLPEETNQASPDGQVLAFDGQGEAAGVDTMQIAQSAVAAVLARLGDSEEDPETLVGLTLEITDGAGEGRFWSIEAITALDASTFELELRNPSVLESAGIADIEVPDATSLFAISQLSANFFADEAVQIDRVNVYNDGSMIDDVGSLQAIDGDNALFPLEAPINLSGLGMGGGFTADLGTPETEDDIEFAGGITMDDLEILEILLGQGDDELTIGDTLRNPENHGGITIVHGGGGDDTFDINGGGGAASPLVVYGDTSQEADRYVSTLGQAFAFDAPGDDTLDASDASESVTLYGGGGNDTITGGSAGDNLAGGSGNDTISGGGDTDLIYGDSGINVDPISRSLSVPTTNVFANPNTDDLAVGNDTLSGDGGDDVVFGDHGVVERTFDAGAADALWNTAHATITIIRSDVLGEGGDDIIYGNAGADVLIGGSNTLDGEVRGGDAVDGGADDDLIFGDNVILAHREAGSGQTSDPRTRVLDGTELYDGNGGIASTSPVDSAHLQVSGSWSEYQIVNLDHSLALQEAGGRNFGDDYLAGGADDDMIFGQLGDDVIQGDGSIGNGVDGRVGATRNEISGLLEITPSSEAGSDGDDYIEGNGGDDVLFGNLGQDDIIGGSSELFTLIDPGQRPDGSDTIFGGSGQRIGRNYEIPGGDLLIDSPHANDADAIAGDNANIYRLVGLEGTDGGAFLTFEYDAGRGPERIIVRAIDLLDYTPGGEEYDAAAAGDIGAGDEIHGESGDDFIYGMKGSDQLFGDSEDDDIIAGYGNDWVSGGTGTDGVLGDDGRIYTSRNTNLDDLGDGELAEPLYGIEGFEDTDVEISTPGDAQVAIINKAGELKKTANLTPFNVDPLESSLYDAEDADDILFGGLGRDFLHGGSGDDAISGAEAIAGGFAILYGEGTDANRTDGTLVIFGFDNPTNPGNVLGYSALRAGEFAEYDEFHPRERILDSSGNDYFLNFSSSEGELLPDGTWSDGDDVIFGDLGNDWIVGGTGKDNLYGGRGDDLLNADDDLGTNNGLNDTTDTSPGYADRAFGGAGRDVLLANTGADRLIDWAGEFNSYLVPFGVFGAPTISRAVPPSLYDFLYELSASDGADPTRGEDEGTGADDPRNGEPFGELGLVTQKDFDWQAQTGAPADVQPGNIPGGERDVMQIATFNDGNADAFLADVGEWSVESSRLQVEPEFLGGDAVSVYYVDDLLPSYFEIQATIQAGKPTAGYKSNSYLIFDYQSPTDFKFAGVNISTDKLEMGHRDANGWHVDVQLPAQLRPDRDYNLLLAINGTTATLLVNNRDYLTHTFEARVDADGFSYGLNAGLVGIGAFNSKASIDNVKVQVLPKDVMPVRQSDFDGGLASFLAGQSIGQWATAEGYLVGSASAGGLDTAWGGQIAYTTSDVRIAAGQILEIETTLAAGSTGGVVFDQYGATDFKFVYIDEDGVVSIGHQSGASWDIEASAAMPAQVQGDYELKVSLVGSTVNVVIDGQTVLSFAYNALTGDGAIGLLAAGDGVRFDDVVISTNDPAYLDEIAGEPLRAAGEPTATPGETLQAGADLQPLLDAAIERWTAQLGRAVPGAENLQVWVTDLGGDLLGLTIGNVIYIDRDAAGLGWFIDATPDRDEEFDASGRALGGTDAANGVDLLSVLFHEVGHVLGFDHEIIGGRTLGVGERISWDTDSGGELDANEHLGEQQLWMAAHQAQLNRGISPGDLWHRSHDVVNQLVASLLDAESRIVPVNLGMFGSVAHQLPWAFAGARVADSVYAGARAMLWNDETGEFEAAVPFRDLDAEDDDVLEFLEDEGDWAR